MTEQTAGTLTAQMEQLIELWEHLAHYDEGEDVSPSYRLGLSHCARDLKAALLSSIERPAPKEIQRACPHCHTHESDGGVVECQDGTKWHCLLCGSDFDTPDRWQKLAAGDPSPATTKEPKE